MIARVGRFQVKADKLEGLRETFETVVIPSVKHKKGYRGGTLLIDRKACTCVTIGFWETEADALADEQSSRWKEQAVLAQELFAAPPVIEMYEVAVRD